MIVVGEKISALNKKHVGTALRPAQIVFDGIEKPTRLDIETAKILFQESIASAGTQADIGKLLE